jgi:hypothetical protein
LPLSNKFQGDPNESIVKVMRKHGNNTETMFRSAGPFLFFANMAMWKLVDRFPYYDPKKEPIPERIIPHLRQIAHVILDSQFDGRTLQFAEIMKVVSTMTGLKHDFGGTSGALKQLDNVFNRETGHLISACVLTRGGSPSDHFFERAVDFGLLEKEASEIEREEFWTREVDFFTNKGWGQILDMLDDVFA